MPKFSIITTCKDRLEHLKKTLPLMLLQEDAEVIVVDFSCTQGTGAYIEATHPQTRVVYVKDKSYFSNWEARNAGAAAARGDWLVFVDADVLLAPACTTALSAIVAPGFFGRLEPKGDNSLFGFQVIRKSDFVQVRGYDELLKGWGAGGDMDILF